MKFKLFTLFILLNLVLAVYGTAQAAQPANQDEIVQQIDGAIQKALRRHDVPGVAVAHNGELSWVQGYGLADSEQGIAVTPERVFDVALVSKLVTAWGIMELSERKC